MYISCNIYIYIYVYITNKFLDIFNTNKILISTPKNGI